MQKRKDAKNKLESQIKNEELDKEALDPNDPHGYALIQRNSPQASTFDNSKDLLGNSFGEPNSPTNMITKINTVMSQGS